MPNVVRTHMPDLTPSDVALAPRHLSKQQFAKRLYRLMLSKGWNQSELARRAGLPRDSVSTYVRGKVMPTPQSAQALAQALGVTPEEIMPNHVQGAIDEDEPSLEMKVSVNSPRHAWLRVNRLVSLATAARVIDLIESEDNRASDPE